MSIAPNETPEGYARKCELQQLRNKRQLTLEELKELSALCKIAISHMEFHGIKGVGAQ